MEAGRRRHHAAGTSAQDAGGSPSDAGAADVERGQGTERPQSARRAARGAGPAARGSARARRCLAALCCVSVCLVLAYCATPEVYIWGIRSMIGPNMFTPHVPEPDNEYMRAISPALAYDAAVFGLGVPTCASPARLGRVGDGGYVVCLEDLLARGPDKCVVYSFGIADDWSFDKAAAAMGCEVHSFDPSMGMESTQVGPRHFYHNVGLASVEGAETNGWELWSIAEAMERLDHTHLSALKIDVEGAEWGGLERMFADGILGPNTATVGQLILEIHLDSAEYSTDNEQFLSILDKLVDGAGFTLLQREPNPWTGFRHMPESRGNRLLRHCMNLSYLNRELRRAEEPHPN